MDDQTQAQAGELQQSAQKQATGLRGLVPAQFGTLSAAENLMLEKAVIGEIADCSTLDDKGSDLKEADDWTPKRRIRAELLAWLCTNELARKQVHPRGIQVYGADVTGPLDLSFANIPFQLRLLHCRLSEDINLSRAEVSDLDLQGSLVHGLMADRLLVKNNVFLRNGFTANGQVRLLGAQIGSDLSCLDGTFTNKGGYALSADGINVKGGVLLRNGFSANGEVRLLGAQIGGYLTCTGGTFTNEGGYALNADRINVKGAVLLRNGFSANGEVRLVGAQIGSNLECDAGTFTNEGGNALNADNINVKGSVFLRQGMNAEGEKAAFSAKGEVNLVGAEIDGLVDCNGGVFSNPKGDALNANRSVVKGSVLLNDGFSAEGRVYLGGAQIGGYFSCTNGNFQNATLDLTDASAGTLYDSGLNDAPGSPADYPPTLWPQSGHLLLVGFTYGRISSKGRINAKRRIRDWLELQPRSPFHPKPYLQLAKILKESGDDKGSKRVLIEMEDRLWKGDFWGPVVRPALRWTVGYGYYPLLIILWAALLTVVGWFIYQSSYHAGGMVPTEKEACATFEEQERKLPAHYPGFSPFIYSVENSLPLVKLGQADKWQPDPAPDPKRNQSFPMLLNRVAISPHFVRGFLWIQILLGWLLATLFVAGVSGIVHKD